MADDLRPTYGQPEKLPDWDDDGNTFDIPDFAWDLSFGCTLIFGHDIGEDNRPDQNAPLNVTISTSDRDRANGITVRRVTREQLIALAQHLLDIAGTKGQAVATDG